MYVHNVYYIYYIIRAGLAIRPRGRKPPRPYPRGLRQRPLAGDKKQNKKK
jgi:hypothetical protein